jgi:dipeptidyl-peptidase-4
MSHRYVRALWCLVLPLVLAAQKRPVTIESVSAAMRPGTGGEPIQWAPDGRTFLYQQARKLFLYDVAPKSSTELASLDTIEASANKPSEREAMAWENRRVSENPVQWSESGKELLLSLQGDLFLLHCDTRKWDQLTATETVEADPKLSPDGKKVAFRRGHDLYVMDIAGKAVKQLTFDGADTIWNAELDWVYPEELGLGTAYWWAPDSQSIAYLQFDISRESLYPHADLLKMRALAEPQRYPKAGTPNADVHLGVVPAVGGETKWMDAGETRDWLLARVAWQPDSAELYLQKLNRVQNQLLLLAFDPKTGKPREVLRETDKAWVNIGSDPQFLKDGSFLWTSERSGFRHIYRYERSGKLMAQLTKGDWEVSAVAGVDESAGRVYYLSTEASPLERQLYWATLDGSATRRLTRVPGSHTISLSPGAAWYLDTYSSLKSPSRRVLCKGDGTEWTVYREADHKQEEEYDLLPTEIVQVTAGDGTILYARLIKPVGFQPGKKYPAIVMVYGGPHAQSVRDAWSGLNWEQALAHKGFVIWQLDNRGSAGRGHAFESKLYRRLGKQELDDQLSGIRQLTGMGFVDPARLGLYGWSYGGFMTLYSLTNSPKTFRAGVAGAPVTDWRNYDSIYTERYLGLPQENEEGYKASSPVTYAGNLEAQLMIVHNIEDDNVLFANTMQMMNALQKTGKLFDLQLYPQKSHGVSGPVRRQMLETITAFFEKNLK